MLRHCALYHRFIRAGFLVCSLLIAMLTASGQKGDSSLTKDFPKLSSKERSRIAAKEVEESKKDDAYQLAMLNAERSFQQGRYEEALVFYESARALRPYNVYPKVKIEDLHALINKQTIQTTDTVQHVAQVAPPPVPKDTIMPTVITEHVEPDPLPKKTTPVKTDPVPVGSASQKAPVKEEERQVSRPAIMEQVLPDGVTERRYQDGHAFVIERTITEEGRAVVYKRVFHNWGKVFYFEDGVAVDERVWKERFSER